MPELPEVETIARGLAKELEGRTIRQARIVPSSFGSDKSPTPGDPDTFSQRMQGRRIEKVSRRAKLLLLELEGPLYSVFHLKMTGRLMVRPAGAEPGRHTRLLFDLDDGRRLFFDDSRKFGWCRVFTSEDLQAWDFWRSLGPEPLDLDARDLAERYAQTLGKRRAMTKSLLLDQGVVAGVGNIYADEILFAARVRPTRRGDKLGAKQCRRLAEATHKVLTHAVEACGSSIRDYVKADGDAGAFQDCFQVYGRAGEPCTSCGRSLEKTTVSSRTTVYCPRCQA